MRMHVHVHVHVHAHAPLVSGQGEACDDCSCRRHLARSRAISGHLGRLRLRHLRGLRVNESSTHRLRHLARVRLEIVRVEKGRLRQHDRVLAVPPDVPPAVVLQPPAPPDVQPRVEADEGALRVPPRLERQREVVARSLDVVVDGEDGARAERGQRREAAVERVRQHVKLHPRRAIDAGSSANAPPVGGRRRPSLGPHHAHGVDHVALGVVLHRTPQHIGPLERVEHRRHTLVRRPRVAAAGLVPRVPLRGRRGAEREALPQGSRNGG
mmetsp:Transcript_25481/g.73475  ORF Transcript_25481/g.73475 Transcript_25481/m.73475 type:complete len:268 (+) Transcript_25481:1853-2656(+)